MYNMLVRVPALLVIPDTHACEYVFFRDVHTRRALTCGVLQLLPFQCPSGPPGPRLRSHECKIPGFVVTRDTCSISYLPFVHLRG